MTALLQKLQLKTNVRQADLIISEMIKTNEWAKVQILWSEIQGLDLKNIHSRGFRITKPKIMKEM